MRDRAVLTAAFLVAIGVVALVVRTYFPYGLVFAGPYVNFQTPDSWYHMRLIDYAIRNFPRHMELDPYLTPFGGVVTVAPMLDLVTATTVRLLGLGAAEARTIDAVAAWVPPVLGALCVVPAYAIGRRLFGSAAGLFGAALLAVVPGPFLDRSRLGYTDHHVLEVLLSGTTMALLLRALDEEERRRPGWPVTRWSVLTGLALGAYLLCWGGAALLVFVVWLALVVQSALDAWRGGTSGPMLRATATACLVACAFLLLVRPLDGAWVPLQMTALGGALATALAIWALERVAPRRRLLALLRPVVLWVAIAGAVALMLWRLPGFAAFIGAALSRLRVEAVTRTVGEAIPLSTMLELFTPHALWGFFGTSIALGVVTLPVVAYRACRQHAPAFTVVAVWALVLVFFTTRQHRFAYYLTFVLAVLGGGACGAVLRWTVRGAARPVLARAVVAGALTGVAIAPNLRSAAAVAATDAGVPAARHAALEWLRRQTPEPFADPEYYFARPARPAPAATPARAAYTVMTWWDYGYEVIRIGRRVPTANPTQYGARFAATFFLETDERLAARWLARIRSRYVLVTDEQVHLARDPRALGAFQSMGVWAGKPASQFMTQVPERLPDGRMTWTTMFHPAYYQTMVSRLYLFGGQAETPRDSTWVVTWASTGPREPRSIAGARRFATHEDAQRHLDSLGPGPYSLASFHPLRSPVPIPALRELALVHESDDAAHRLHGLPSVRIFEVRRR